MSHPVAQEILRQLGGGRFVAMTGAKNFVGSENSLSFQLTGLKKIKGCRIVLNAMDTYDVDFGYVCRKEYEWVSVKKFEGVYNDNLQEVFTSATGLYTKL